MKIREIPGHPHPFPWLFALEQKGCQESKKILDSESRGFVYSGGQLVFLRGVAWIPVANLNRFRNEVVNIFNKNLWKQACSNPKQVLSAQNDAFWIPPEKPELQSAIF